MDKELAKQRIPKELITRDFVIKYVMNELMPLKDGWLERSLVERRSIIKRFEARVKELSDIEAYDFNKGLKHHYGDRTYGREIFIDAGTLMVGGKYKEPQINVLIEGVVFVMTENTVDVMKAPCVYSSDANTNKVGFIIEDMRWLTVVARDNTTIKPGEIMDDHLVGGM